MRYENLARTPPTLEVASQQRVSLVARLFDRAETAADPQPFVQALPIAATMTRLPRLAAELAVPIRVKAR